MTADVVIPSTRPDRLERLLSSLGPVPGRVIVVDGSRRSPAAARNAGWRRSSAEWIVFLDDDVVVPPISWSAELAEDLHEAEAVGAVGSQGRVTVLQPGGERDGIGQRVSGVAPLQLGDRVVLFLERSGPYHRVVGMAQGVYRVVPVEGSAELRAVPASLEGLELVSPGGRTPEARTAVPLSELRTSVQAAR